MGGRGGQSLGGLRAGLKKRKAEIKSLKLLESKESLVCGAKQLILRLDLRLF